MLESFLLFHIILGAIGGCSYVFLILTLPIQLSKKKNISKT